MKRKRKEEAGGEGSLKRRQVVKEGRSGRGVEAGGEGRGLDRQGTRREENTTMGDGDASLVLEGETEGRAAGRRHLAQAVPVLGRGSWRCAEGEAGNRASGNRISPSQFF